MSLTIRAYDPAGAGYPHSLIPILPRSTFASRRSRAGADWTSAFANPAAQWFASGRYALHAALKASGVGPTASVLLPSYHCRSMLDPVVRLGGNVMLYSVDSQLSPNFNELSQCIAQEKVGSVKALVLPHYFGFPNRLDEAREFVRQHPMKLIEDCSHAWFGSLRQRPLGTFGDFSIASAHKFFGGEPAGVLLTEDASGTIRPRPARLLRQAKGLRNLLGQAVETAPSKGFGTQPSFESALDDIVANSAEWQRERIVEAPDAPSAEYQTDLEMEDATIATRAVVSRSDAGKIVENRRRWYRRWREAVYSLPNCRPLVPDLPDEVVPYMFPLVIADPEKRFHWLKLLGVPMYRWDELAESPCSVAQEFRLSLVHLPCHQSLTESQMEWLTSAVSTVMLRSVRIAS